jgi:hypothetical protein
MAKPVIPSFIQLAPIDDRARDGSLRTVFGGAYFALARFRDGAWRVPGGIVLDFMPTDYRVEARP